jgi:DNA-binding MarR family transcriptional regulator
MTAPGASSDPLVEVIAARLRRLDLVGWQRIASWAEQSELSFADLRILLAMTIAEGQVAVTDLAESSGLSLHAAYPAIRELGRRGYLSEERRRYELTERGRDLAAALDEEHRAGIQSYVDHLDPDDRQRLEQAFGIAGG